jgi:hypothetical protein
MEKAQKSHLFPARHEPVVKLHAMAPGRGAVRYLSDPYDTKAPLTINVVLATDWSKCVQSVLIRDSQGTTQNFNNHTCQILEARKQR